MENKKPTKSKQSKVVLTFKIIGSTVFIGAFIFCATWTIKNWNKVSDSITNGTNISTEEDLKNSWADGYKTAFSDKEKLEQELNDIKENYTQLIDDKAQSDKTYQDIINANQKQYEDNLAELQQQLQTSANNIAQLNKQLEDQSNSNTELNNKITELNNKISTLSQENTDKTVLINELQADIAELREELNNNFVDNNTTNATILAYQEQIAELQASLKVYEDYYNQSQENQVIVTFKIGEEVYQLQTITKGNNPQAIADPESTDYFIFNGWLLNGESVDPTTCILTENTTFVADATYKYDANFYNEDTLVKTQIVERNATATAPTIENTDGKIFEGWSLDGTTIVDPATTPITSNTNFYAVFTYKYTVTFVDNENNTLGESQIISYGEYANYVSAPTIEKMIFVGWTVDGVNVITINQYPITTNTTFIPLYKNAKIITENLSYKSDSVDYMLEGADISFSNILPTTKNIISVNLEIKPGGSVYQKDSNGNTQSIKLTGDNLPNKFNVVLNTDNNFETTINYTDNILGKTSNLIFRFYLSGTSVKFEVIELSSSDSSIIINDTPFNLAVTDNSTITYYSSTEVAE